MKKVYPWAIALVVVAGFWLVSCTRTPSEFELKQEKEAQIDADIQRLADEYAQKAQGSDEDVGAAETTTDEESTSEANDPVAVSIPPAAHGSDPLPDGKGNEEPVRTVLVDQDYTGITSIKGINWVKAINAKKITGNSKYAFLTVELSRNGVKTGFETLGMYVAPLDEKGQVIPSLEWRHVRYIDAVHLNNTRALAASSNLSTMGAEGISTTYDLSAFPTTKLCDYQKSPAYCPDGQDTHDFTNAFRDYAFWIGFLPSRSTAHVKVTLLHDGNLTVTPAVK